MSKMTLCYDGPQNLAVSVCSFQLRLLIFKSIFLLKFEFKEKYMFKAYIEAQLWCQTARDHIPPGNLTVVKMIELVVTTFSYV